MGSDCIIFYSFDKHGTDGRTGIPSNQDASRIQKERDNKITKWHYKQNCISNCMTFLNNNSQNYVFLVIKSKVGRPDRLTGCEAGDIFFSSSPIESIVDIGTQFEGSIFPFFTVTKSHQKEGKTLFFFLVAYTRIVVFIRWFRWSVRPSARPSARH